MATIVDASISYILEDNLEKYRRLVLENCQTPLFFSPKTAISLSGQPVNCLYFLLDGIIKIYTNNCNGYTKIVGYHKKNTIFAMDNLAQRSLAVVTAESITSIRAVPLYESDLIRLNRINDSFLIDLLRYYCYVLRLMCFDAENLSITSITARLANFLVIYMRSSEFQSKGYIAMSQYELSSAVNASLVQLTRVLRSLRNQGIVSVGRKKIHILDYDSLYRLTNP